MSQLGVTMLSQPFPHLMFHGVLTYSNWEHIHNVRKPHENGDAESARGHLKDVLRRYRWEEANVKQQRTAGDSENASST
jgi:hypothetical protein